MEEVIKIEGGRKLSGTVRISGSKNATVALIPAAILSNGPVTIVGVPTISDVKALAALFAYMANSAICSLVYPLTILILFKDLFKSFA